MGGEVNLSVMSSNSYLRIGNAFFLVPWKIASSVWPIIDTIKFAPNSLKDVSDKPLPETQSIGATWAQSVKEKNGYDFIFIYSEYLFFLEYHTWAPYYLILSLCIFNSSHARPKNDSFGLTYKEDGLPSPYLTESTVLRVVWHTDAHLIISHFICTFSCCLPSLGLNSLFCCCIYKRNEFLSLCKVETTF